MGQDDVAPKINNFLK